MERQGGSMDGRDKGPKISKKRKMKIDKIKNDNTLSEAEKERLIAQLTDDQTVMKRPKRSQMTDYRDQNTYLAGERNHETHDGKANKSELWNDDEKSFLEDVTLNLIGDDEHGIKGKTVMRWDSKKKRHILVKVDRDGRIIKEKKNEAG